MKKLLIVLVIAALAIGLISILATAESGGGSGASPSPAPQTTAQAGNAPGESIYFLNFKPEVAEVYAKIAAACERETGIRLRVETAASGEYETTLMSEIAKTDAPTIFQVNGPVGLTNWKDYAAPLGDTRFYGMLSDKSLALSADGQVLAVPYAVEGYGIIYNAAILNKYFALENRKVEYDSVEDIRSFEALRAVAEEMTQRKEELGIQGVFASSSLAAGNQWRWQTHLLNLPMYYEWKDAAGDGDVVLAGINAKTIAFSYAENFKNLWDLYLRNATTDPGLLSNKTVDDSMAEFALGQCAMVQNGNWGASQILGVAGNTVSEADIRFLPLYTGVPGEETQGLCIGTENYLCINKNADEAKRKAADDFLYWLFSSQTGKAFVRDELGFIAPFSTFGQEDMPSDPLSVEVMNWMNREGVTSVPWVFAAFPSEAFKNYVGDALLEYAQGGASWDDVVKATTDSWASERQ